MGGSAARPFTLALFAMALAACSWDSKPEIVEPNIYPAEYRTEIINTLRGALLDATNVRDAYVSDPVLTPVGRDQRYAACVRYNARDGNRQYMGSTDRIAYFFGGRLNQLVDATKEQCGKAAYKPFPELQKLCLAKECP